MIRTFGSTLLFALIVPLASTAAQVPGAAVVRTGCTNPAPPGSLYPAPASPTVYVPDEDGVVVMEIESTPVFGNWSEETSLGGFSGDSYFRWAGPNLFGNPGVDPISFRFHIEEAGDYIIRVRTQQNNPDSSSDNDCWFKIDDGPWLKLFGFLVNVWNFGAILESTGSLPQYNLSEGVHEIQLSGRSNNFKIDRVDVIPLSIFWADENDNQSDVQTSRPIIGQNFLLEADDPTNSGGLVPPTAVFVSVGPPDPNYPCGTVVGNLGELLVVLPFELQIFSATWTGPGNPAKFTIPFPNDPSLLGVFGTWQGAFVESGTIVFTDAVDILIGDV